MDDTFTVDHTLAMEGRARLGTPSRIGILYGGRDFSWIPSRCAVEIK